MKGKKELDQRVLETIKSYGMLQQGEGVVAGVSGGADSVCLLAVLRKYREERKWTVTAVHVEHGLRGSAGMEDAAYVERLCREWEIPCYVEHIEVKELADRKGQSLEEAGRQARYEIFEKWRKRLGAGKIAVAHNENDQAETVLMNLVRGSGLQGLGGMQPVRGSIIRPLLTVSRQEIEEWLLQNHICWRTDATNLETDYTRNKLRLQALPWLEREINPEAVSHLARGAAHVQKAQRYLEKQAERLYEACVVREEVPGRLDILLSEFLAGEELMQEYVLRRAAARVLGGRGLKDYGENHIRQMQRLCRMDCGHRMDFPGGLQAVRQEKRLVLRIAEKDRPAEAGKEECCFLQGDGVYTFLGQKFRVKYRPAEEAPSCFQEKKYTKWLAYDTITDNICLRTRRTGDYLLVNDKGGRKKLKDYLIDQKVPREERDQIVLVAQGSHILWVTGYRISQGARVVGGEKRLLEIQMMVEGER